MTIISLFTPVNYQRPRSSTEDTLSTLSNYFYLGGAQATVVKGDEVQLENGKISWITIALKVASYVLFFPLTLTLLAINLVLRSQHHFTIFTPPLLSEKFVQTSFKTPLLSKEATSKESIQIPSLSRKSTQTFFETPLLSKKAAQPLDMDSISEISSSSLINHTKKAVLPSLQFIISENTEKVVSRDGASFEVHKVALVGDGEKIELGDGNIIRKTYSQLNILFQTKDSNSTCLDHLLPEECKNAVLKFILKGRPSVGYNSVDLFMDTQGYYSDRTLNEFVGKWDATKLDENSLNPGDGIIIYDEEQKPVHCAIYLINGTYLALYGTSASLAVTTLSEMKKAYGAVTAYKLTLKEKENNSDKADLSVLQFIITENIEKIVSQGDVSWEVRKVALIGDGEKTELNNGSNTIRKAYSRLRIFSRTKDSNCTRLDHLLSEECKNALLKFILKGRPLAGYCCVDFFMDTHGCYSDRTLNEFVDSKWDKCTFNENSLNPGDGIVIYDEGQKPVHWAIYLINGTYLSLYGTSGPLAVATLNEMKKAYEGVDAYKWTSNIGNSFFESPRVQDSFFVKPGELQV